MSGPRLLFERFRPNSETVLGALLTGLLGAVLCFLPGLDQPNYHAAFITAIGGSLLIGPIGIAAAHRALRARKNPFVAALKTALPAAFMPLVLLLLNGLRVRQCDVFSGVAFMLIGPAFSIVWAALLGAALGAWQPKKRWAVPLFYLVFLAWAAGDVLHIYEHPAIFAYNPFAGFFSGAIYDAVIVIDDRLALYRLNNVAQLLAVIGFVRAAWDHGARRARFASLGHASLGRMLAFIAPLAVAFGFWVARGQIGYEVSRADVQAQLGAHVEDERITLYYDKSIPEAEARQLLEGHRFRLDQIEARIGYRFPRRITSYVYATPDQKRRLMGAGQVYIAKPWLDEIHLNRVGFDNSVIRHELAHVVLGIFADPPVNIPTGTCFIPQMALVEGAAEAFEWDAGQLTPHEWSAVMRKAQRAPDLRTLIGPGGFYNQGSDTAYTLSGSFIRWLIDRDGDKGMSEFEAIYRDGDFEGVLGQSVDSLVTSWEHYLDALAVPADAAGLATGRFNTPAIHHRPCGLDVARLEAEAAQKRAAGDREGAKEDLEQVVAWIPEDAMKRKPLFELAAQSGDLDATRTAYWVYLAVPGNRNPVDDASVTELMADTIARHALTDHTATLAEAHRLYATLRDVPQLEERWRNTLVKIYLSSDARFSIVMQYLLDGRSDTLKAAMDAFPSDPLVAYLGARRAHNDGRHAEALPLLRRTVDDLAHAASDGDMGWVPWVRREAARLIAFSEWSLAEYAAAGDAFRIVASLTPYDGDRDRYLDWAERCAWKLARTVAAPAQ